MAKVSKASEHYRESSSKRRRCGTCAHMLSNGGCEVVEGKVEPGDVCDSWEGKPVRASVSPHMARIIALADYHRDYDQYDQRLAAERIADRFAHPSTTPQPGGTWRTSTLQHLHYPSQQERDTTARIAAAKRAGYGPGHGPLAAAPSPGGEGRTRDYERVERGKVEHVSGHIQSALKAHLLAQHPGVYAYLQEGRDLEALDELHHTDHERHNMHPTHHYEPPDVVEHPADRIIGDVSKSDVDESTGQVRDPRAELVRHLASVHHSPEGERASMGTRGLRELDREYHEGHVFRPGERGSYK